MEQKSNVQYRAEKEYKNSRKILPFITRDYLKCDSCCINQ